MSLEGCGRLSLIELPRKYVQIGNFINVLKIQCKYKENSQGVFREDWWEYRFNENYDKFLSNYSKRS